MRTKKLFLLASICSLMMGCEAPKPSIPKKTVVYVAGTDMSLSGYSVAVYWKDNVRVPLGDSTTFSHANSIFVTDQNDVYVAGDYEEEDVNLNFKIVAMLWKNGNPIPLTDGTNEARAYGVTVVGNDVYVAGYEITNRLYAKCWKNGQSLDLQHPPLSNSTAWSVQVIDGDVYVGGTEFGSLAYWKNGVYHLIKNSIVDFDKPVYMGISGSDVYLAGTSKIPNPPNFSQDALIWKNDNQDFLPTGIGARGIAISSGGDLFFAGNKWVLRDPGPSYYYIFVAKYWKNGNTVELTDGTTWSETNAIALSGNDVYVAGIVAPRYDGGGKGSSHAVYWKNGIEVPLSTKTTESFVNAIFVHNE